MGETGENYRLAASHWQTFSHNVVSSTSRLSLLLVILLYVTLENVSLILKSTRKIVERIKIDNPSTQMHDCWLSWLGTGTLIKRGGVKLVFMDPSQMIQLCKCFPHVSKMPTLVYNQEEQRYYKECYNLV